MDFRGLGEFGFGRLVSVFFLTQRREGAETRRKQEILTGANRENRDRTERYERRQDRLELSARLVRAMGGGWFVWWCYIGAVVCRVRKRPRRTW